MKDRLLFAAIAAGAVAGILGGWFAGPAATRVGWVGDLFLNALKMLVVPLVFCSMVEAAAGMMRAGRAGRVALVTFGYYLATTLMAVVLGLVLVVLIEPGRGMVLATGAAPVAHPELSTVVDSLFAPNLFRAAVDFQVLPLLVFALLFGFALAVVGETGRTAIAFFSGCNAALLRLVDWLMFAAPFGIAALIAARLGAAGGGPAFAAQVAGIGYYCLTVVVGLVIHGMFVLPVLLWALTGRQPWRYAVNLGEALLTAFSTASSSATLAVTMRLSEERNEIKPQTASFVLPLGATINMDGTALYEAVAAVFIAQAWGIELSWLARVVIVVTATLASIGAAGIPQAGLVTMVLVLQAVGLPLEGISAILAVDWLLDRCRTTVNVWGDTVGAAVVDSWAETALHP